MMPATPEDRIGLTCELTAAVTDDTGNSRLAWE